MNYHTGWSEDSLRSCSGLCNFIATDALPEEVPGGVHLLASYSGMGLELKCVRGALHCIAASDGTSSVDAAETAQELCRQ